MSPPPKPVQDVVAALVCVGGIAVPWSFVALYAGCYWVPFGLTCGVAFYLTVRHLARDPTDRLFAGLFFGVPIGLVWPLVVLAVVKGIGSAFIP